jgi:DNA-binding NarL/FixJ family response regulator
MNHLTDREQQIVRLVVRGLQDKEIAFELGTSVFTVRNQLTAIRRKTGLDNRTQIATFAIRSAVLDVAC